MFYDKFKSLCDQKGVSCNKAALEMGLSNATPSKWKKTGATPDGATLAKVSAYFGIPIEQLLPDSLTGDIKFVVSIDELQQYLQMQKQPTDNGELLNMNSTVGNISPRLKERVERMEKIDDYGIAASRYIDLFLELLSEGIAPDSTDEDDRAIVLVRMLDVLNAMPRVPENSEDQRLMNLMMVILAFFTQFVKEKNITAIEMIKYNCEKIIEISNSKKK